MHSVATKPGIGTNEASAHGCARRDRLRQWPGGWGTAPVGPPRGQNIPTGVPVKPGNTCGTPASGKRATIASHSTLR